VGKGIWEGIRKEEGKGMERGKGLKSSRVESDTPGSHQG